jgi:hypothetical protein
MRKTISIILAVLMVLSCISVMAVSAATDNAKITLNGETYTYSLGTDVTYTCNLKNSSTIENGQFTVSYPSSVLEIKSITFPVVTDAMYNYEENLTDELKFNFSNVATGYNFSDNGVLVEVVFNVKSAGEGTIALDKEVLCNVNDVNVLSSSTFTESITKGNVCEHTSTKTVGKKAATYFAKGYTGDKVCADCGTVLEKGKATAVKKLATPKMKVTAKKKAISVKYTKVKNATGFQIAYKLKTAKTYKKVNVNTKKTKTKTIKSLKANKNYTVKIRAYIKSGKKTAYSSWTKTKTVKVKK